MRNLLGSATDGKLERLAAWPRVMPADLPSLLRESLQHAAAVFEASRALLAWEESDEPWLRIATLTNGEMQLLEEPPAKYDPFVDDRLWGMNFFCHDLTAAEPQVTWMTRSGVRRESMQPLHRSLQTNLDFRSALCLKIDGETVQGHLLILDLNRIKKEDLFLGEMIASLVASRMDQLFYRLAQREAVNEERIRVARDLHDGLLQSFTGVVLQLETAHEILDKQPEEARRLITQLQGIMMSEQRELRAYVDELRPGARRTAPEFDFRARMSDLRERFRNEWRVNVDYEIGEMSPLVAGSLGQETFRLILEALTNSARHGQASSIQVELHTANDRLKIIVADNGVGFPFRGRYNLKDLSAMNQAPESLGGRVTSLNGEMTINSTDSGATVEISVPLGLGGA